MAQEPRISGLATDFCSLFRRDGHFLGNTPLEDNVASYHGQEGEVWYDARNEHGCLVSEVATASGVELLLTSHAVLASPLS